MIAGRPRSPPAAKASAPIPRRGLRFVGARGMFSVRPTAAGWMVMVVPNGRPAVAISVAKGSDDERRLAEALT